MEHHELEAGRLYHARSNSVNSSRAPLTKHGLPREPAQKGQTCHNCGTCIASAMPDPSQVARTSTPPVLTRPSGKKTSFGTVQTGDGDTQALRPVRLSPRPLESSPESPISSSFSDQLSSSSGRTSSPSSPDDGRSMRSYQSSLPVPSSGTASPNASTKPPLPLSSSTLETTQPSIAEKLSRHDSATGRISRTAALSSHPTTTAVSPPTIAARRASRKYRTSITSTHSITDTIISESPQVSTFHDLVVLPLHERRGRATTQLNIDSQPRPTARSLSPPRQRRVQVEHQASTPLREEFSPRFRPETETEDGSAAPNAGMLSRLGSKLKRHNFLNRKGTVTTEAEKEKEAPVAVKKGLSKSGHQVVEQKAEVVHWTEA